MPIHFTPAVERAVSAAGHWANRLGHPTASSVHLLLALLEDEEGRASQLIVQAGLPIQTARERLQRVGPIQTDLNSILAAARNVGREVLGDNECRSEHVLIAVLDREPAIRNSLESAGLRAAEIAESVRAAVGPPLALDEPLDLDDPTELIDASRILDASANRAREALRVVEDYCRLALNDSLLSCEAKEMRHGLAEALKRASPLPLLAARDTLNDVGTEISTASESQRESPLDVARTNLKRLQEALRSLEEYGKLVGPELGSAMEQLRYRAYTLEKAVVGVSSAQERLSSARLYLLVTGSACATALEFLIEEAVAGGVDLVQLREKQLSDRELVAKAHRVRRITHKAGALLIVNDRPDIARLVGADGVHLGQDDMPVAVARRIVGSQSLIGVSTHSIEQLRRAVLDGASYVGIGPVFPSKTKEFEQLAGLDFVRLAARETALPAFALGGITHQNVQEVYAAGARRIAVSAAICSSDAPRAAARVLLASLQPVANPVP